MKKIALVVAMCLCFANVNAVELILNGNFETGTISGWTVEKQEGSSGEWLVYSGTALPISGSDFFHPPGEIHGAAFDQIGPSSSVMYQDVAIPKGGAALTFTYFYQDFDTVHSLDYQHRPSSSQFRVDLIDCDAHPFSIAYEDVLLNVLTLDSIYPSTLAPTVVTYDLKAYEGQTVRLRFAAVSHDGDFKVGVDDISVISHKKDKKKKK